MNLVDLYKPNELIFKKSKLIDSRRNACYDSNSLQQKAPLQKTFRYNYLASLSRFLSNLQSNTLFEWLARIQTHSKYSYHPPGKRNDIDMPKQPNLNYGTERMRKKMKIYQESLHFSCK